MIGRNGERRSGISAPAVRHDDDDLGRINVLFFLNFSKSSPEFSLI